MNYKKQTGMSIRLTVQEMNIVESYAKKFFQGDKSRFVRVLIRFCDIKNFSRLMAKESCRQMHYYNDIVKTIEEKQEQDRINTKIPVLEGTK